MWMRGRQGESEAVMVRWRVAGRRDEGIRRRCFVSFRVVSRDGGYHLDHIDISTL